MAVDLRRRGACVLFALSVAALAGCGFTPLYATPGVAPALESMDVVVPPNSRTGFLLKQQLNDQFARDEETPARYLLTLNVSETRFPRGIRVNNIANRYELDLTVGYTLSDKATARILLQGTDPVEVSYDSADPPYASVAANQDAEVRAANQAAIRVRLDLSRYFDRLAQGKGP